MDKAKFSHIPKSSGDSMGQGKKLTGGKFVFLVGEGRIVRDKTMLEALIFAGDAKLAHEAAGLDRLSSENILDIPGSSLGSGNSGERRIGGYPAGADNNTTSGDDGTGFDDPLADHHNRQPAGTLVGPGKFPGSQDLTGQDSGSGRTDYGSGADSGGHGYVWLERQTSRSSSDGSQTWGSNLYRDYSGNHWRVDYHDQRTGGDTTADLSDDGFTSKETVFDDHNKPVSTTFRETLPDGNAKETTTNHQTGETTTRTGSHTDIFPDRYQPAEGGGGGDRVAPRGWHNPLTGVT